MEVFNKICWKKGGWGSFAVRRFYNVYNKTSFLVQIKFITEDSNGLYYKY